MTNNNLEMKISVDGPIHTAFLKLAEECMKQGIKIESVSFSWYTITGWSGPKEEALVSVNINSSKANERRE